MITHPVNVKITTKNSKPCIELRKIITDMELIKQITTSVIDNKPIILQPTVKNKVIYVGRLTELGIIYKDKNGQYQYNF